MGQVKKINIKNQAYHFFDDMVNKKKFSHKLTKNRQDVDVYYIGYITINKFSDCKNIHSVNPLYLIIHSATGYFKEKNREKYLILDSTEKYREVFSGIRSEIKQLMVEKNYFMKNVMLELELILTMIFL